jgi:Holliday junction resolvase RusA-like endonuclease
MIALKLPIEPIAAARPRVCRFGTYYPKRYDEYKKSLRFLIRNKYKAEPMAGALEVCVVFSMEKPKSAKREYPSVRPDIDNLLKGVFDAANEIIWMDDSQIVDLHAFKAYGIPSITISVKPKGVQ